MIKQNKALQNLKRNLFRQAINYQAGTNFIEDKGVFTYLALWHFFADPTDENAVEYIIHELQHEIEKLERKEIPQERWPKFLQKEDWKEQTYLKFCVPYPGTVNETTEDTPQSMNPEQRTTALGWSKVGDVVPRVVNNVGKRE